MTDIMQTPLNIYHYTGRNDPVRVADNLSGLLKSNIKNKGFIPILESEYEKFRSNIIDGAMTDDYRKIVETLLPYEIFITRATMYCYAADHRHSDTIIYCHLDKIIPVDIESKINSACGLFDFLHE